MRSTLWWLIRTILQQSTIYCNTLLCLMQGESKQGCRELKSIAFSSPQRYQLVSNYLFVVFIVNPNNSKVVNAPREKMKLHIQFIPCGNKLPGRKSGLFAFLWWSWCRPAGWSCLPAASPGTGNHLPAPEVGASWVSNPIPGPFSGGRSCLGVPAGPELL